MKLDESELKSQLIVRHLNAVWNPESGLLECGIHIVDWKKFDTYKTILMTYWSSQPNLFDFMRRYGRH